MPQGAGPNRLFALYFRPMTDREFLPGERVLRNLAAKGDAGLEWLDALPPLIARLEWAWGVAVGATFPAGTEAFAAEAMLVDGTPVAIKIPVPGSTKEGREARVLEAAEGRGYAKLLRHDPASGALLLERLGPQLAQLNLTMEAQIEIICATLRNTWTMPSRDLDLLTGAQKADVLAGDIHRIRAAHPGACSDHVAAVALRFCDARRAAYDPANAVIAHGDAHAWNLLSDNKGGFKFVDPDGLFIERAHDLSISMREWSEELKPDILAEGHERCASLSRLTGVDPQAIWQWSVIERLVNGLTYIETNQPEHAAQFIDVAEIWARADGP